jgi:hypothetical protein
LRVAGCGGCWMLDAGNEWYKVEEGIRIKAKGERLKV